MGGVHNAGQTVQARFHGADEIEAEEGQVAEVLRIQGLGIKVGMNEPESLETGGGGAESLQAGDQDASMGADDHIGHFAPPAEQHP